MKIGELAECLGVGVGTLRFYEQKGLVLPGRSAGGTRSYDEESLARFRAILGLAQAGVPLDALAQLAQARPGSKTGDAASRKVAAQLQALEAALTEKQQQLRMALADIRRARRHLPACHGCRKRPTRRNCQGCAAAEELLAAQVMRLVWDQADDAAPL